LLALASIPLTVQAQAAPNTPPVNNSAKPAGASIAAIAPLTTAPVRAAQVLVVDDEAHSPYQEGVFNGCASAGACTVAFSTVPAGHRRLIEHFSCSVYVSSSGALRYVAFLANSFAAPRDFFPFSRSPADPGQYFVNSPTLFSFAAGEAPLVYAYADTAPIQELTCTATGRDILVP
jgi:hypothetical protein